MPELLQNSVFRDLYCPLAANDGNNPLSPLAAQVGSSFCRQMDGLLPAGWEWVAFLLVGSLMVGVAAGALLGLTAFYQLVERRVLARFQGRIGPNRWGPLGLGQVVADPIKLLTKEDVVPKAADPLVFTLSPLMMVMALILLLGVLPIGKGTYIADLNIGLLYLFAVSGVASLSTLAGAWASSNRYSTFGAIRGVAQLISYEVPIILALVSIPLFTESLSLVAAVDQQRIPFALLFPLPFLISILCLSAEASRTPFDIIEAESELIAGYHTEMGGVRFALLQTMEFAIVLVWSGVLASLFLQGYRGPFLPSHVWFALKTIAIVYVFIWVRATFPRLRVDQIMALAWKYLLPLSLLNLVVVTLEAYFLPDNPGVLAFWGLAALNWVVGAVLVFGLAALLRRGVSLTPAARWKPQVRPSVVPAQEAPVAVRRK